MGHALFRLIQHKIPSFKGLSARVGQLIILPDMILHLLKFGFHLGKLNLRTVMALGEPVLFFPGHIHALAHLADLLLNQGALLIHLTEFAPSLIQLAL